MACDATDPVFTPGDERSAQDVPFFRVVLPLPADPRTPIRSRRRPSTAEERHCEERLCKARASARARVSRANGTFTFSFLDDLS